VLEASVMSFIAASSSSRVGVAVASFGSAERK
jgi:hypothetical protein